MISSVLLCGFDQGPIHIPWIIPKSKPLFQTTVYYDCKRLLKFERCGLSLMKVMPTVPGLLTHPVEPDVDKTRLKLLFSLKTTRKTDMADRV